MKKVQITIKELDNMRDLISKIEFSYIYIMYNNDRETQRYYEQQAYLDKRVLFYIQAGVTIPQLQRKLKREEKKRLEYRKQQEKFNKNRRNVSIEEKFDNTVKYKNWWNIWKL